MRLLHWLRSSIVRQYFVVFAVISLLAVMTAVPALILTKQSSGSGGAINVSGSMRMQSYKLALVVADPFSSEEERREKTMTALDEFADKLLDPSLLHGVPQSLEDPVYAEYVALRDEFEETVRPIAMKSATDVAARETFTKRIPDFVGNVDHFVRTLETGLNSRLEQLETILTVLLLGAMGVSLVMLQLMRRNIFKPLLEVERAADAVRQGDFSVRARVPAPNEIGRLASSFNFMVDELGRLYGNLEEEVARKTRDLNRRNEGLELLSRVTQAVTWTEVLHRHGLDAMLTDACMHLCAQGVRVCVGAGDKRYVLGTCCHWPEKQGAHCLATFPLLTGKADAGVLEILYDGELEPWQRSLAEALSQTIGRGIERTTRQADDRRLAVLEERSTIGRELHDSIAQSLSYSRIQMHRLKVFVERGESHDKVLGIVNELSEGISTAYKQLREVLTTFRMQLNSSGIEGAIEETVDEFRNRTGVSVSVTNALLGTELSPNEQIHLVHILREALINVEKHARASNVKVAVVRTEQGFTLTVEDDGIGIDPEPTKYEHFGLSIMAERAKALRGSLTVAPSTSGRGTTLMLSVPDVRS